MATVGYKPYPQEVAMAIPEGLLDALMKDYRNPEISSGKPFP
jgi:hypothetical protein